MVRGLYRAGVPLIPSGYKGEWCEPRTLERRISMQLAGCGLDWMTMGCAWATWKAGPPDAALLRETIEKPNRYRPHTADLDERWLFEEMENDLKPLRLLIGMEEGELGELLGLSKKAYISLERGDTLDWNTYLSLLFLFSYNRKTEGVVESLGLFPASLREKIVLKSGDR